MKITTNHHDRHFVYFHDLTEVQQKNALDDYDYLTSDMRNDHWIVYKDQVYHLNDFLRWNTGWTPAQPKCFAGYDGFTAQSCGNSNVTGLLIKIDDSGIETTYQIASYFC